jgi:hypothetical protein
VTVSCPRCGGDVREPGLTSSDWHCANCGPIVPLHIAAHIGTDVLESVVERISAGQTGVPLWCPWPLPPGWLVTGVGWVGDPHSGVQATAVACSGPSPIRGGPADVVLVAEQLGVGLGNRLGGVDPGFAFADLATQTAHARVKADGRDTPMWSVAGATDRVAYVGEARGIWLYAVAWPPDAGYVLSEHIVLHDLTEWLPTELAYGATSPYLNGRG